MIAGAPLRNEDLRGYETHSQSELVVHEDGTCDVRVRDSADHWLCGARRARECTTREM